MKIFYSFVLCHFILFSNNTQSQNYAFELIPPGDMTYMDLQEDVEVTNFSTNGLHILDELNGQTFWFYNLPFTFGGFKTIAVGEGAFMRVDNDSSLIIIDAAFTNMEEYPDSKISYKIEGESGQHILKSQYKNFKFTNGGENNFFNVQIWYYQQSGVIEIHYGSRSENNASGFTASTGPNVGIFYSPDDFSGCYEKTWCTGNPNNPYLNTASNYVFHALQGLPLEGTIYRFTPLFLISNNIEEHRKQNTFFLNPTKNRLYIKSDHIIESMELIDMRGQVVLAATPQEYQAEIDLSHLSSGIYLARVHDVSRMYCEKIFVE